MAGSKFYLGILLIGLRVFVGFTRAIASDGYF